LRKERLFLPLSQVVVAADSPEIVKGCEAHGIRVLLTQVNHPSGSDRLAEASQLLGLGAQDIVVNVQGMSP
jgi:3-deoxy-manno-octulosonate cytidylyltransferase (CMP-KDO synthetase)